MSANNDPLLESTHTASLLQSATDGDSQATQELFQLHHERLRRMIGLRLDRRLQHRIDENDILQEVYMDVARRLSEYQANPRLPFFLWLRHMAGLKLSELHRQHLGTQKRDAGRELSIHQGRMPEASSVSLASFLVGAFTSPSGAAIREENRMAIQQALDAMEPIDREVLALKHFEQLSTQEIADVLGMSKAGAGGRYLRAIKRLRELVADKPGFNGLREPQ